MSYIKGKYILAPLFLALLVSLLSCLKNSEPKTFAIIEGSISNSNKNNFILISNYQSWDSVYIDKTNTFSYKLETDSGNYFLLKFEDKELKLFLTPNDTLGILIDSNKLIYNKNAQHVNRYLLNKEKLNSNALGSITTLFNLKPNEFISRIDSIFNHHESLLTHLSIQNNYIPACFSNLEKNSLLYEKSQLLLEYASMSPNNYLIDKSRYFYFLENLTINDSGMLNIPSFFYFLDAYVNWLTNKETTGKGELFAHEYALIEMQVISRKFATGLIKDKLLYNALSEHIKFKGYKNSELLFKTFEFQCGNKALKEKVTEPYESYLSLNKGKKAPDFSIIDINSAEYSLLNFKGKFVYVDVWATWCKPCIEEAPYFEALKEKYKHKNIEFVSISIDKKKEKWLKYCTQNDKSHNQFWIEDAKAFLDAYYIKTIPHFILIDEHGNIIKANANRPSDNDNEWLEDVDDKVEV